MLPMPPRTDLPPSEVQSVWAKALVAENAALREENATLRVDTAALREIIHKQKEEIQALRDEIARLKRQSSKPKIRPSQLTEEEKKKRNRRRKRNRDKNARQADRTEVIKAQGVPEGSRFKGYDDFWVQEIVIQSETVRYRVEKWRTPDGALIRGQLPTVTGGRHFGPTLVCFVLYQYYHALVTEPLLWEQLHEWGVRISSGQLHRLITEGKETFHREKAEILRVGLRVSAHIQTDDTGARHQGKNGYCTHIGNEWFAWFESTESKSRINFLQLLRAGHTDYVLGGVALEYMVAQKLPARVVRKLHAAGDQTFAHEREWKKALQRWRITKPGHVRIATEGALLGSALAHGLNPGLAVLSDDAGQFRVLCHGLCWVHAERILAKLIGFNDEQRRALEEVRTVVWQLYRDLKSYQAQPTADAKQTLSDRFDALCATQTCFTSLNQALARMHRNKSELLLVLERPDLPLHNNLSENDIREYVKRRKISGSTRSEAGRRCRDTFASLKKTCRKLRVSFWDYLADRVHGENRIPRLPDLIEACARAP
jgi:hypothetical protein